MAMCSLMKKSFQNAITWKQLRVCCLRHFFVTLLFYLTLTDQMTMKQPGMNMWSWTKDKSWHNLFLLAFFLELSSCYFISISFRVFTAQVPTSHWLALFQQQCNVSPQHTHTHTTPAGKTNLTFPLWTHTYTQYHFPVSYTRLTHWVSAPWLQLTLQIWTRDRFWADPGVDPSGIWTRDRSRHDPDLQRKRAFLHGR